MTTGSMAALSASTKPAIVEVEAEAEVAVGSMVAEEDTVAEVAAMAGVVEATVRHKGG